jgi:hypothetical protein
MKKLQERIRQWRFERMHRKVSKMIVACAKVAGFDLPLAGPGAYITLSSRTYHIAIYAKKQRPTQMVGYEFLDGN